MKSTIAKSATVLAVVAAATSAFAGTASASTAIGYGAQNFAGGNWGGYVSFGSFTTATASWTEPSASCTSSNDLVAPWVGIDGDGSSTVEQTGVETNCDSGSPAYRAWYEMYPAAPVYYDDPVSAGDQFTATVTLTATNTYKLDLSDTTKGWSETVTKTLSSEHSSAEAIIESPTDSYPDIPDGISFNSVKFDGQNLADTSPSGLDADDKGSGTWSPSGISNGTDFVMTKH